MGTTASQLFQGKNEFTESDVFAEKKGRIQNTLHAEGINKCSCPKRHKHQVCDSFSFRHQSSGSTDDHVQLLPQPVDGHSVTAHFCNGSMAMENLVQSFAPYSRATAVQQLAKEFLNLFPYKPLIVNGY